MIFGIGIDIVAVSRIAQWLEYPEAKKLVSRFFADVEIAEADKLKLDKPLTLAARFAAKEAFGKALGTGLKGLRLKDIAVQKTSTGRPELVLSNTAKQKLETLGITGTFVSLSHEKDFAVAVVVLEK